MQQERTSNGDLRATVAVAQGGSAGRTAAGGAEVRRDLGPEGRGKRRSSSSEASSSNGVVAGNRVRRPKSAAPLRGRNAKTAKHHQPQHARPMQGGRTIGHPHALNASARRGEDDGANERAGCGEGRELAGLGLRPEGRGNRRSSSSDASGSSGVVAGNRVRRPQSAAPLRGRNAKTAKHHQPQHARPMQGGRTIGHPHALNASARRGEDDGANERAGCGEGRELAGLCLGPEGRGNRRSSSSDASSSTGGRCAMPKPHPKVVGNWVESSRP
ncbi:hypothetical protein BDR26DRAFT_955662 [Obelidium mucronatum]|nr:hypothetical protein BDR26DRAFT_955662 [Obelidium mucronatum]